MQRSSQHNAALFWPVLVLVAVFDFCTKSLAAVRLAPSGLPHSVLGDWMRLTLVRNPGAAFGLNLGTHSRLIFTIVTIVALIILAQLYHATRPGELTRTFALGLLCGGAIGNLADRLLYKAGVIDFIDIGFGDSRWPTFNIADMALSVGACLLAYVLWSEDAVSEPVALPATAVPADGRDLS